MERGADRNGVALTAGQAGSAAAFDRAVEQYFSWRGDPVATLQEAIERDADFALGHTTLAALASLGGARGDNMAVQRPLAEARARTQSMTSRERLHLAAAEAWAADDPGGAATLWEAALLEAPRDVLALRLAHDTYFFLGAAPQLRDSPARVLPAWAEGERERGYVLGMHAFGLEETGDYAAAERAGRAAVEANPADSWAVHAVAHVLEMQGRFAEGVRWLENLAEHWTPAAGLACHQWWHLTLFLIEQDRIDDVLAIYDREIRGAASLAILDLVDAAALLWRLALIGVDVGERWPELATAGSSYAEDHVLAFNDVHIMMSFAGAGQREAADRLEAGMAAYASTPPASPTSNRAITRTIGLPLARAVRAFREGRFAAAVALLLPLKYELYRLGGSNAERDLFHQTLLAAALDAGDIRLARALAAERLALKPASPRARMSWRQIAAASTGGAVLAVARATSD